MPIDRPYLKYLTFQLLLKTHLIYLNLKYRLYLKSLMNHLLLNYHYLLKHLKYQ
jgi:hypothetical protein